LDQAHNAAYVVVAVCDSDCLDIAAPTCAYAVQVFNRLD
tara:strand:+ start:259 stop:375 length:117 start_codon:yes stop_codon:yes gene_type:complete